MEPMIWMIVLAVIGFIITFGLHKAGKPAVVRGVVGGGAILTGVAFIGFAIVGGRAARDFQEIVSIYVAPLLLGLVVGSMIGRSLKKR